MADLSHPPAVPTRWWPRQPAVRRATRILTLTGIVLIIASLFAAVLSSAAHRALVLGEHLARWCASLGPAAVIVVLGLCVIALVAVAVTTEREFSERNEWYDGH